MELFDKSKFRDKAELHAYIVENKDSILAKKKAIMKEADGIPCIIIGSGGRISNKALVSKSDAIDALLVINTTKLLDSYKDMHVDRLWKKSLSENRFFDLNQEHNHGFKDIIADGNDLKAYTEEFSWKELGFKFDGNTQALMYDAKINKTRNSFMFDQYNKGYVRNHSVEMYYVKLLTAINDPQYKEEYEVYDKYFPMMANKEDETEGYFFPVLEAKHVGGAAVTKGANFATPVYDIKSEPENSTQHNQEEPPEGTLKSFNELLTNEKFF